MNMNLSGILTEYFFYQDKYAKLYGDNCIAMMMVGEFYEAYAIKDKESKLLSKISECTNLVKTKKNKLLELSERNPYLLGFHMTALQKFIRLMIDGGLTIAVIDQITNGKGAK